MKINIRDGAKFILIVSAIFFLCGFSYSPKYKLIPAKVLTKIKIPKWYHEGLYFDGKNIWVNNGQKGKIWIIDTSSGKVIGEIDPAGTFTEAIMSKEKDKYFVTDWDFKKIYTARIDNNIMSAESEVSLAPAHPAGAIWNGKNLFVITWTRSLIGTRFHLLKMDDKFNILSRTIIKTIQDPSHLVWDGKHLWVSSWYDPRIYKVDDQNFEILGYFRSPVKKTTGIAWDGKYFWVTGTYSDLYKMEVQN